MVKVRFKNESSLGATHFFSKVKVVKVLGLG